MILLQNSRNQSLSSCLSLYEIHGESLPSLICCSSWVDFNPFSPRINFDIKVMSSLDQETFIYSVAFPFNLPRFRMELWKRKKNKKRQSSVLKRNIWGPTVFVCWYFGILGILEGRDLGREWGHCQPAVIKVIRQQMH